MLPPERQLQQMLQEVGIRDIEELFADVPRRLRAPLELPAGLAEHRVEAVLRAAFQENVSFHDLPAFLGAGHPMHPIPAETRALGLRGEFLTAYTPYQPEINQGLLQALFEFQTLTARLLGQDVANTGVYDGSTAMGEAALLALRATGRKRVLVPDTVPPQRRRIVQNYILGSGGRVETIPTHRSEPTLDAARLDDAACLLVEYPSFLGTYPSLPKLATAIHDAGGLLCTATFDPYAVALATPPGALLADVSVGEGQCLATPPTYGGPGLGLFACRKELLRQMPGRIVGMTKDAKGQRAYTLTLQTREQHIRRARATSNICTNEALLAVLATSTLTVLGEAGFRAAALECHQRARALQTDLQQLGCEPLADGPIFNEFALKMPVPLPRVLRACRAQGVEPGLPLERAVPGMDGLLTCVTQLHSEDAAERLVRGVEDAIRGATP